MSSLQDISGTWLVTSDNSTMTFTVNGDNASGSDSRTSSTNSSATFENGSIKLKYTSGATYDGKFEGRNKITWFKTNGKKKGPVADWDRRE
jgi:hypothetical protein